MARYLAQCGEPVNFEHDNEPVIAIRNEFYVREDLVGSHSEMTIKILCLLGTLMNFAVRQCSYCKIVLGIKPCVKGGMTHGVCPACIATLMETRQ